MAEVTLVTDKDHAVPVRVERSGVRSVVFGAGAGRPPELRFMAPNADIKSGDKLLTSGIDGTYPAGLAVARSTWSTARPGRCSRRSRCVRSRASDRSTHLLVLGQAVAQPPRPEEAQRRRRREEGPRQGEARMMDARARFVRRAR